MPMPSPVRPARGRGGRPSPARGRGARRCRRPRRPPRCPGGGASTVGEVVDGRRRAGGRSAGWPARPPRGPASTGRRSTAASSWVGAADLHHVGEPGDGSVGDAADGAGEEVVAARRRPRSWRRATPTARPRLGGRAVLVVRGDEHEGRLRLRPGRSTVVTGGATRTRAASPSTDVRATTADAPRVADEEQPLDAELVPQRRRRSSREHLGRRGDARVARGRGGARRPRRRPGPRPAPPPAGGGGRRPCRGAGAARRPRRSGRRRRGGGGHGPSRRPWTGTVSLARWPRPRTARSSRSRC